MNFNREILFSAYKEQFNTELNQAQIESIERLLAFIENDPDVSDLRWAAYLIATVKQECANRWVPIEEFSSGKQYEGRCDLEIPNLALSQDTKPGVTSRSPGEPTIGSSLLEWTPTSKGIRSSL